MTFCNPRWNADRGSSKLRGQAEPFLARKRTGERIDIFDERHCQLPRLDVAIRNDCLHVGDRRKILARSVFLANRESRRNVLEFWPRGFDGKFAIRATRIPNPEPRIPASSPPKNNLFALKQRGGDPDQNRAGE